MTDKILVADDTKPVLDTFVRGLEHFCEGLKILQAGTRKQALAVIAENDDLKVVVTDLCMPHSSDGEAVAGAALEKGIKVIVLSSSVRNLSEEVGERCFRVLDKLDTDIKDLARVVKEALDNHGGMGMDM